MNLNFSVASSELDGVDCWCVDMTFSFSVPVNLGWCVCVLLVRSATGNMHNIYVGEYADVRVVCGFYSGNVRNAAVE